MRRNGGQKRPTEEPARIPDEVSRNADKVLKTVAEFSGGPSPGASRRPLPTGRGIRRRSKSRWMIDRD
jgi:hypothetical protein